MQGGKKRKYNQEDKRPIEMKCHPEPSIRDDSMVGIEIKSLIFH
jgi:hypothetical protein